MSFPRFCAKVPTETISPIRAATRINLKYFIYLAASLRLSFRIRERRRACAPIHSATWMPNRQACDRLTQIGGQGHILLDEETNSAGSERVRDFEFWGLLALFRLNATHLVHESYLRTITLKLPTLLLLSYARNDIVCSPGPPTGKSNEKRSR